MTQPDDSPFDALERRDPQQREAALLAALPAQVAHVRLATAAGARLLADVDPAAVTSREALATLPVVRKSELAGHQRAGRADDPFGGFAAIARGPSMRRIFASPGPIYEPEGTATDPARMARALHAAGFRAGDLVHNSFSYHMTPAGFMMDSAAHALGCTVFPAGTGPTELQLEAIADLRPAGYVGTPGFLRLLLDKAVAANVDVSSLTKALVSGEAFPPALREAFRARGVEALQCYASADLGLIAYETRAREGLVVDEGVLVEIVRPGTGEPLPEGEIGEVVVTTFDRDYPLLRLATGDLSAVLPGPCPTGRTNQRLRGWLGRADQTTKVRGMFVHPAQVAAVARRFPELGRVRLVVDGEPGADRMTLHAECADAAPEGLAARIAEALRELTKLRGEVVLVAPGSLPNDGLVIVDGRRPA